MTPSGDRPFWESDRAEVVKWHGGNPGDIGGHEQSEYHGWNEGPITSADEALITEHYIIKLPTREGDRYYTVHYPPTADFDLDFEIDRIESEYAEDFA